MLSKNISIYGIVSCLILLFSVFLPAYGTDITGQIITHIDKILKENPLPFGKEIQMINISCGECLDSNGFYRVKSLKAQELKSKRLKNGFGRPIRPPLWISCLSRLVFAYPRRP